MSSIWGVGGWNERHMGQGQDGVESEGGRWAGGRVDDAERDIHHTQHHAQRAAPTELTSMTKMFGLGALRLTVSPGGTNGAGLRGAATVTPIHSNATAA